MSEDGTEYFLFDFSRVLLFPADENYTGSLNDLYREAIKTQGYNYFEFFRLNEELIDFLKSLIPKYHLGIFTSEIVQNDPAINPFLKSIFVDIVSSQSIGVSKTEKGAYAKIAQQLHKRPGDIVCVDDKFANVKAALDAGCIAIQYISNSQIIGKLKELL